MGAPGPAHERLAALEGDWSGEEVLGDGGTAHGRFRFGTAIDGLYLLGDYQRDRDAAVHVHHRGHAVIGWDAESDRYAMWWFDSSGLPPAAPATGTWVDATLTVEGPGPGGASRCTFTVEGERLRVRIEHAADGSNILEGTYSRA